VHSPDAGQRILIHLAALPVPLNYGLTGALGIGASGAVATCDIQSLNPVNIPAIGYVCLEPVAGCSPVRAIAALVPARRLV